MKVIFHKKLNLEFKGDKPNNYFKFFKNLIDCIILYIINRDIGEKTAIHEIYKETSILA